MTSAPQPSAEIDEFLSGQPPAARAALEHLRSTIARAAPEAVESIAYGVPAFRYRGRPLVSFGATTSHLAFYVQSPMVLDAHRDELGGWATSKGTIRFSPQTPIPDDLVTRLVRARMAETDLATR